MRIGKEHWAAAGGWLLLLAAAVDLAALKAGWVRHSPTVLAILFTLAMLALVAALASATRRALRDATRRATAAAESVLLAGVLLVLGGGMANWLLGLQGVVVLNEGEAVRLSESAQLQEFEAGPLARLEEMEVDLALGGVELEAAGEGAAAPRSRLEVRRRDGEIEILEVTPRAWAGAGALRFHQGAFGFAPRVVILSGAETVFDRVVPFRTRRDGPEGITFEETFTLASHDLEVRGRVDLATLDEGLRGHAGLELQVYSQGVLIGRGSLLPGHFAEIGQGYRVGFAALERWSEIDVSRRHYPGAMQAGMALAVLGALAWPLAWWRAR